MGGAPVDLDSPLDARRAGIETVYQDLALADHRSCVANVYIGREIRRGGLLGRLGVLDRAAMARRTTEAFDELSVPVTEVERPVRLLSGGQRQGVAIARAAIWARTVVLLDEPTAALGVRQRAAVDALIEQPPQPRLRRDADLARRAAGARDRRSRDGPAAGRERRARATRAESTRPGSSTRWSVARG